MLSEIMVRFLRTVKKSVESEKNIAYPVLKSNISRFEFCQAALAFSFFHLRFTENPPLFTGECSERGTKTAFSPRFAVAKRAAGKCGNGRTVAWFCRFLCT